MSYNFEKIRNDNIVIGFYKDKAIVENEENILFYIDDCDENLAPIGTVVDDDMLIPLFNLRNSEREIIERTFGRRAETWER